MPSNKTHKHISLNLSQHCENRDFLESLLFLVSLVQYCCLKMMETTTAEIELFIEHAERSTMSFVKWMKYRSLSTEYIEIVKMNERNKWDRDAIYYCSLNGMCVQLTYVWS